MAPKGKKGKKQADDWENELGEDATATANDANLNADVAQQQKPQEDGAQGEDADVGSGGGGLLAALKKNKDKRKKKGKVDNDFVEGEDIAAAVNGANGTDDTNGDVVNGVSLADKAPEEATMDDEDVFANDAKKGKGGKKDAPKPAEDLDDDDGDDDSNLGGGVMTKKEKEKLKKEREKQRKKEQVRSSSSTE